MSATGGPVLVIGIGNVLLRDEGVGVRVVRELDERVAAGTVALPATCRLIDGGTLGLDLLPMVADARGLILVDAVDLRRGPGTTAVIRGEAIHGVLTGHVSPHQVGIGDLVATARLLGTLPEDVALVGIQPSAIEIGLDLTEAVQTAIPGAVSAVLAEVERFAARGTVAAG